MDITSTSLCGLHNQWFDGGREACEVMWKWELSCSNDFIPLQFHSITIQYKTKQTTEMWPELKAHNR
jgi:hypothetical protein